MSLNYFLKKKTLENYLKDTEDNTYYSDLPVSLANKFAFNIYEQIEVDRFIFDFIKAYGTIKSPKFNNQNRLLNLASMFMVDEMFTKVKFSDLLVCVQELDQGRQPKNKQEHFILNVLEVLALTKEDYFVIDENNFEMFIHIIFKNTDIDLEYKSNYYRTSLDKTKVNQQEATVYEIDQELDALFKYINKIKKIPIQGFSQAFLIFIDLLYISPYRKHNFVVAVLLMQWYLNQTNKDIEWIIPTWRISRDWEQFLSLINNLFEQKTDAYIDGLLKFLKNKVIEEQITIYKRHELNKWIKEKQIELSDTEFWIVSSLLNIEFEKVNIKQIYDYLTINNQPLIDKKEIERIFKLLIQNKIIKFSNNKYMIDDLNLKKIRHMLKTTEGKQTSGLQN